MIPCDEIIEVQETKTVSKNIFFQTKSLYALFVFLLIIIALLIAFSIYFCSIKYKAKQKSFITILHYKWPINKCIKNMDTNDELNQINIKNRMCFDDIIKMEDLTWIIF